MKAIDSMIRSEVNSELDYKLAKAGLEAIVFDFVSIICTAAAALLTDAYLQFILFNSVMMTLRQYTGGYHAKTHLRCSFDYTIIFVINTALCNLLSRCMFPIVLIIITVSECCILTLAPLTNTNNPLTQEEFDSNRSKAFSLSLLASFASLIFWPISRKIASMIILAHISVSFLMLVQVLASKEKAK